MHWSCRRRTSTQNTWQQTRFFKVNFDSNGFIFIFTQTYIYNSEKHLQFRKKIKAFKENFWFTAYKQLDLLIAELNF